MLNDLVWLCTTQRVGQNAVLDALRSAVPGAAEYGAHHRTGEVMVYATQWPRPVEPTRRHHLVYITRRDRLAQAISWAVAAAVGRFHSWQEPTRPDAPFDVESVRAAMRRIDEETAAWQAYLRDKPRVLHLTYEDDIASDPQAAAARILAHCGLPGSPRRPRCTPVDAAVKARWHDAWEQVHQ